jgi:TolB protein
VLKITTILATLSLVALSVLNSSGQAQAGGYPAALSGGSYMHNFYIPPFSSSAPWAPDWAPDGQSIAVAMSGSIWMVDRETGIADELTYSPKYHSSPDWSPDGKWLIYTADDGGETIQLEIINVETDEARSLTDDEHLYLDPVFSPDGSKVAYVSTSPNGYYNVYVRPIENGQWSGEAIAITQDHKYPKDRLYFGEWDMNITPAWFPNSEELLLVSNREVPLGSGDVLRVPVEEDGILKATTVLAEQTLYRTRPDVSIDSKRFVYSSTGGAADQFSNLYVQPTTGGHPYKLTFFQNDAFHPRWSPDGEWIAFISNVGGLPKLALLETYGGEQKIIDLSERRWKRPTGMLKVRTRHKDTVEIVGARVYLTAADGKAYAPANSYARVSGSHDNMFHSSGEFELELPVGPVELLFTKGFEFKPKKRAARIETNETTSFDIELEQFSDFAARSWYSGSTHVHMNYGGNLHNSYENLLMISEAEDQDLLLHQIANKDNRILDYQFFEPGGEIHSSSTENQMLVVGQEYRPPFWGHVFMFGMKDHLISPFANGYEGTGIGSPYPSNTDMLRKARNQGAWVGYVHAFHGDGDPLENDLDHAKGFMVDAALGTTDAVEWADSNRAGFYPMYAIWNNGLRVSVCGGEDSISNLHWTKLVGSFRTYVYTFAKGLKMKDWFDGLKNGHAFVSNGPLIDFKVDDRIPGETVKLPSSGGILEIAAEVKSIAPLEKVLLVFNGEVVEEFLLEGDRTHFEYRKAYTVIESGWYHLRAEGNPEDRFPLDALYAQAFTNPVWIEVGDQPIRNRESAEYSIRWIEQLRGLIEDDLGWRSQSEKDHVFGQFEEAKAIFRSLGEESKGEEN